MARLVPTIACCVVAALAVSGAFAFADSGGPTLSAADTKPRKNLWATVNICDTAKFPDRLGIRARAPGTGQPQKIWMRFFAEYMKDGRWVRVDGARSKWIKVGSAEFKYQEIGYTFRMGPLTPGDSFRMRGLVKFQWRRNGKVQRATRVRTTGGHTAATGGDPEGYSKATCFMSGSA